jgi:hypothetical protein
MRELNVCAARFRYVQLATLDSNTVRAEIFLQTFAFYFLNCGLGMLKITDFHSEIIDYIFDIFAQNNHFTYNRF